MRRWPIPAACATSSDGGREQSPGLFGAGRLPEELTLQPVTASRGGTTESLIVINPSVVLDAGQAPSARSAGEASLHGSSTQKRLPLPSSELTPTRPS